MENKNKENKYITKEEAMKTFNEYPEYVMCISAVTENYNLNKIYKVELSYGLHKVVGEKNRKVTSLEYTTNFNKNNKIHNQNSNFIAATKEEYDAQFEVKQNGDFLDMNSINVHKVNNIEYIGGPLLKEEPKQVFDKTTHLYSINEIKYALEQHYDYEDIDNMINTLKSYKNEKV